jgi:hypothetical protein
MRDYIIANKVITAQKLNSCLYACVQTKKKLELVFAVVKFYVAITFLSVNLCNHICNHPVLKLIIEKLCVEAWIGFPCFRRRSKHVDFMNTIMKFRVSYTQRFS